MAEQLIVKTYKGSQERATSLFQEDAAKMATEGYFPTSQKLRAGSIRLRGCTLS